MATEVIAVFDIGKTNKKFLLFDSDLKIIQQTEVKFPEITDEDGFPCDDIESMEAWIVSSLKSALKLKDLEVKAVNFTTYGASLMYIDEKGKRLTPVYNYLKPMPDGILDGFYDTYGGINEFSRLTASPAMGMLNSGLQILWIKKTYPGLFAHVDSVLHFPQYVSYLFTRKVVSEYTSIGCHTAMWDFDNQKYHQWLGKENIRLPEPVSNETVFPVTLEGKEIHFGIGIHDSSSSMVPYIKGTKEEFILMSTGTWCIIMNPFNNEPLTPEQLEKDSLCYMSIRQQPVKSSRFFLGHIHDVNVERMSKHFSVKPDYYKTLATSSSKIASLHKMNKGRVFFKNGIPADYIDNEADLNLFGSFDEAYHKLMFDLTGLLMESFNLVVPEGDKAGTVYITGGFARSEIFVSLIASWLPERKIFISEVDNATALGAAMVVWEEAFGGSIPDINLGLKRINYKEKASK